MQRDSGLICSRLPMRTFVATTLLLAAILTANSCRAADAIVVRPAEWSGALEPWLAHRAAQGIKVKQLDSEIGRAEIQNQIRTLNAQSGSELRYVLLAGDVSANKQSVPTFYKASEAMVQFGGDAQIATDNPYADIDDDGIPDLSIGRIPADTKEQLAVALQRAIDYESSTENPLRRRDIHVVAGVGGFGVLADSVIEMTTKRFLSERIPGWSNVTMTQASLSSKFCPNPYRFCEATVNRFNQGSMFWVYIGHGHVQTLDYLRMSEKEFLPIMNSGNMPQIDTGTMPPIAVFLACYTGAFDLVQDSLAEQLVLSDKGSIAAIAATRVSGPYGLATLSDGLLDQYFRSEVATLGEVVLLSKRRMLAPEQNASTPKPATTTLASEAGDEKQTTEVSLVSGTSAGNGSGQMQMIRAIASALSPKDYNLRAERQEHVWQMHLLGDPMLRIRRPMTVDLHVPDKVKIGEHFLVTGELQQDCRVLVELAYRRQSVAKSVSKIQVATDSPEGRQGYQQRYEAANSKVIISNETQCSAGKFELALSIPSDLPRGKYCVRLFAQGPSGWHAGYQELVVKPLEN